MTSLDLLPEDCLSNILSFASPYEACCLALVATTVRSTADSDNIWAGFLPSDYPQILSTLASPLQFSSKKELFQKLCHPQLIDGGRKMFSLDKLTGKKRYIFGARELSISWAANPLYWCWKPLIQSRFSEVVELRTICWLEIHGKFNTKILSPETFYVAYLIVKLANRAYGLDSIPSEVSLEVGDQKSKGKVYLRRKDKIKRELQSLFLGNRTEALRSRVVDGEERSVCEREDGWIEIELGSFYNHFHGHEAGNVVEMYLKEVTGEHLKGGLVVEGIEVRPKY